jgi:hypothetical protein
MPLGEVEPVHAQQHQARLAQRLADLPGPLPYLVPPSDLAQGRRVDRDRERGRPDLPRPARVGDPHGRPSGGQADGPAAGAAEVGGVGPALEAQQVGAEQPLHHRPAPRKLGEDLVAGERDVVEEADPDVVALLAQHPRDQLELVVVHPDGRPRCRLFRRGAGEAAVDRHVRLPPPAVELRRRDDVVVERPQRRVAEALVEVPDLRLGDADGEQLETVRLELPGGRSRVAGPADPDAPGFAHHRLQGSDQAARARLPFRPAVRALDPVYRQPAGHHHELVL